MVWITRDVVSPEPHLVTRDFESKVVVGLDDFWPN
jgi:hypothetical protein